MIRPQEDSSGLGEPRILSPDRLEEWRDFAADYHRIFAGDTEMDPMELVDHVDALKELLDREVKVNGDLRIERRDAVRMLGAILHSQGGVLRVPHHAILEADERDVITRTDDPVTEEVVFRLDRGRRDRKEAPVYDAATGWEPTSGAGACLIP